MGLIFVHGSFEQNLLECISLKRSNRLEVLVVKMFLPEKKCTKVKKTFCITDMVITNGCFDIVILLVAES